MTPIVSILVPVYNVASFIEKCAHSLFQQTYDNIEYVFVNDATPDNSMLLLEQVLLNYPKRKNQVSIIHHDINQGIGATRNTLLNNAHGEFLMWVDSDDFITTNAVEMLVNAMIAENTDVAVSDCYFEYRGDHTSNIQCQNTPTNNIHFIEAMAFRRVRAALWGTMSKRSIWIENHIQMVENMNFAEDYYTTVRVMYFAKKITIIHQPFYYYNHSNPTSYTTGQKKEMHFHSIFLLFQHLDQFFEQQNDSQRFEIFIAEAKLMEYSALLLHTSSKLRKKYGSVLRNVQKQYPNIKIPLSCWQMNLLRLITKGHYLMADAAFLLAKVMRKYFSIPF